MNDLFGKINMEGNLLYPKNKGLQCYDTITNSSIVNNMLFEGALILSRLLDKDEVSVGMFKRKFICKPEKTLRSEELIAEADRTLSATLEKAISWFSREYAEELELVKKEGVDSDGKARINTELTRACNAAKALLVSANDIDLFVRGFEFSFTSVPEEDRSDNLAVVKDKINVLIEELSTKLYHLVTGTEEQQIQQPAPQQIQQPAPQQIQESVTPVNVTANSHPAVNVHPQNVDLSKMRPIDSNSFINFTQTEYYTPQFSDNDIKNHFVIGDNVLLPKTDDGSALQTKLLGQAMILNNLDVNRKAKVPSMFTITNFVNNDDWIAESIKSDGTLVAPTDKAYMRIVCTDKGATLYGNQQ